MPPDNAIIDVPFGFQLPLFVYDETRRLLSTNNGGGKEDDASLDINMSLGTTGTLSSLAREMREIQILAGDESLPDAAIADMSLPLTNVDNGGHYNTSRASTMTQATFNSSVAGEGSVNFSAAGRPRTLNAISSVSSSMRQ
jgi:hypothetical protein